MVNGLKGLDRHRLAFATEMDYPVCERVDGARLFLDTFQHAKISLICSFFAPLVGPSGFSGRRVTCFGSYYRTPSSQKKREQSLE
jgi:hypothetical protein